MEDQHDNEQMDDLAAGANGVKDHQPEIGEDDQDEPGGAGDDLVASLSSRQQKAIIALVTEPTLTQAAKSAEVGERTLRRWLHDATFNKAYRTARRESFSQALALALRYTPLAINTLGKLASDTMTPPSSRVSACNGILKFARDSIELDDLQARIEALETAASQQDRWRDR